jgi:hypothetical protein
MFCNGNYSREHNRVLFALLSHLCLLHKNERKLALSRDRSQFFTEKEEIPQVNYLIFHLKTLEKEEQSIPRARRK